MYYFNLNLSQWTQEGNLCYATCSTTFTPPLLNAIGLDGIRSFINRLSHAQLLFFMTVDIVGQEPSHSLQSL